MVRRHGAKADDNQPEIVREFRRLGWSVQHVHSISNFVDIVIGRSRVNLLIEIKDGTLQPSKKKLTDGEQTFFDEWKGVPPIIIESKADCVQLTKNYDRGDPLKYQLSAYD